MSLEDRHYFNKIRKNMNASIDAGKKKNHEKIQHTFRALKKPSHQTTNRKELPQFDKGHL